MDSDRPEREPLHYNVINIRPHGETDELPDRIAIYSRVSFRDEFVSHPKQAKQVYRWEDAGGWVSEQVK